MWAEYIIANLEDAQLESRAAKAGRKSIDGTKLMVRFMSAETPWANAEQSFKDKADANAYFNKEGGEYVPMPSVEEQAANAAARLELDSRSIFVESIPFRGPMFIMGDEHSRAFLESEYMSISLGAREEDEETGWPRFRVHMMAGGKLVVAYPPVSNDDIAAMYRMRIAYNRKCSLAMSNAMDKLRSGDFSVTFQGELDELAD